MLTRPPSGAPMTMQIARKVMDHFRKIPPPAADVEKLTPREHEVLTLPAKGCLDEPAGDEPGSSSNPLRDRRAPAAKNCASIPAPGRP